MLMLNAKDDEVIPRACTEGLWTAAGEPEIVWLSGGRLRHPPLADGAHADNRFFAKESARAIRTKFRQLRVPLSMSAFVVGAKRNNMAAGQYMVRAALHEPANVEVVGVEGKVIVMRKRSSRRVARPGRARRIHSLVAARSFRAAIPFRLSTLAAGAAPCRARGRP